MRYFKAHCLLQKVDKFILMTVLGILVKLGCGLGKVCFNLGDPAVKNWIKIPADNYSMPQRD